MLDNNGPDFARLSRLSQVTMELSLRPIANHVTFENANIWGKLATKSFYFYNYDDLFMYMCIHIF